MAENHLSSPLDDSAPFVAPGQGFEPRFYGPEPYVLPIGRSRNLSNYYINPLFCQVLLPALLERASINIIVLTRGYFLLDKVYIGYYYTYENIIICSYENKITT